VIEVTPVGREPEAEVAPAPEPARSSASAQVPPREPAAGDPRSGPLAELLLRETLAAARSQLRERTSELAQVRGALSDARAQLDAGDVRQGQMDATHAELRAELQQLSDELARAQAQLAAANASRDGALSEATGLRVELDRLGGELAAAREQLGGRGGELGQARALLADARAQPQIDKRSRASGAAVRPSRRRRRRGPSARRRTVATDE
jgi:chromosome segregation ATPase